jgi:hypothetical protein
MLSEHYLSNEDEENDIILSVLVFIQNNYSIVCF